MGVISLRLLLATGETHTFSFPTSFTADEVVRHVYSHWPVEWDNHLVDHPNALRLLYQGKFIDESTMLSDLRLQPNNKTTVMHLLIKDKIPSTSNDSSNVTHKTHRNNQQLCCLIL
jgi:hypothetical protein